MIVLEIVPLLIGFLILIPAIFILGFLLPKELKDDSPTDNHEEDQKGKR